MTVGFGPLDRCFDLVPLGSVALAIKDGTHGTHTRVREGVPFLSAKNISAAGAICWGEDDDRITESEYAFIHQTFRLEDCDLLLTIVGSLGRRAIYRGERVTFQRSVAYIRPDAKKCSERFLFHWFGHPCFQQELVRRSNATAQAGLYLGELAKVSVPKCPNKEQSQIARVLDTLDTTIRQTEAIIAKLKQVKQGLLHDLLTRGIDANGELRPPQPQAPQLYKQSPLGWIPKGWDAVPVSELAVNLDGMRVPIKEAERRFGVYPYYGASGIIDWVDAYILDGDFVLLGEDGENVVSRNLPLAFRVTGKIWVNNHAHILEPKRGVDIRFLAEVLEAKDYGPWVSGSAQPKLTQDAMARISFLHPQGHEQTAIADRLGALSCRITAEQHELTKLRTAKLGLMDDLLTGRVRVTPLLEAATTQ